MILNYVGLLAIHLPVFIKKRLILAQNWPKIKFPVFSNMFIDIEMSTDYLSELVGWEKSNFIALIYIYNVIYRDMGTFLAIFNPGFAPLRPQNKVNLGDIWRSATLTSSQPLISPMANI